MNVSPIEKNNNEKNPFLRETSSSSSSICSDFDMSAEKNKQQLRFRLASEGSGAENEPPSDYLPPLIRTTVPLATAEDAGLVQLTLRVGCR